MLLKLRGLALLIGLLCCSTPAFAQATGGCCLPDGTCESLTEADCLSQGGVWNEGVDCGDACPGACCLPGGGGCEFVGQVTCELTLGGFFQGNSITCDNANCRPFGACCLPTGECVTDFEDECVAAGGVYQGDGTTDCVDCFARGACCAPDGTCAPDATEADCDAIGGVFQGGGVQCGDVTCEAFGACCLPDGTCEADATVAECSGLGGMYQGDGVQCGDVTCEAFGACCLPDGTCQLMTPVSECAALGGVYEGDGSTSCIDCEPFGACCLPDGTCDIGVTISECSGLGGIYQGDGTTDCVDCEPFGACCFLNGDCVSPVDQADCEASPGAVFQGVGTTDCIDCFPRGACCLTDGSCEEAVLPDECVAMGGAYEGDGTLCADANCSPVVVTDARTTATEKGSVFIIPDVQVLWHTDVNGQDPPDESGRSYYYEVFVDTFVQLTNDDNNPVDVQMYFVNGDPPADGIPFNGADGEFVEPGWNWVDVRISLTANQTTYWSASTGLPAGVSPWAVLDPPNDNTPYPGRFLDGGDTVGIRGFIVGWAVDADNKEIDHNHLAATATLVDYEGEQAVEYNAYTFAAVGNPNGDGTIMLDGAEYAAGYDLLLVPFQAIGSTAYSSYLLPGRTNVITMAESSSFLALMPIEMDLRQETGGPVVTKAHIDIWNENEVKFSGAYQCIECWSEFFLDEAGAPHARRELLQTDFGKMRIDGLASQLCEPSISGNPSQPASLLGVRIQFLDFDNGYNAASAANLYGMGTEAGVIRYDRGTDPIPTNPGGSTLDAAEKAYNALLNEAFRSESKRP